MANTPNPTLKRTIMSLPTEIITGEIFAKLPAKSLLRFKCVSKTFNAFISSPEFIDIHLRHSISSDANRLLILILPNYHHHLFSVDVDSRNSSYVVNKFPIPNPGGCYVQIVGSVNGLLCITPSSDVESIFINPCTGFYREIPYKSSPIKHGDSMEISYGFGFDDINRDYKLVRIGQLVRRTHYFGREVMVYSLNASSWKLVEYIIHGNQPYDKMLGCNSGVLLKNHYLHWRFYGSDGYHIYCFDTRSDKWVNEVPLMDMVNDRNENLSEEDEDKVSCFFDLGVIDGCLCLSMANELTIAVWVMKEYRVKESWLIPSFISPCFEFIPTFGCFGVCRATKYEILYGRSWDFDAFDFPDSELMWYNIESGKTEVMGIPDFLQAGFFNASLVPILNGRKIETSTIHHSIIKRSN